MVLYKYCPKCYSLNIAADPSGGHKCRQCSYTGPVSQDSIDKINIMKKSRDGQRYAAATSGTRPTLRSTGRDTEIVRSRKEDPYNDEIDSIEISDSGNYDDDEPNEMDELESKQSNIMKRSSQPTNLPRPMHGLANKDGRSLKERLKDKGGKDWDLV